MLTKREMRMILRIVKWLLCYRVGAMATKLAIKKPAIKKPASSKVAASKAPAAPAAMKVSAAHKKIAAAKATGGPYATQDTGRHEHARNRAETIQVLRDAEAGKNLVRYSSVEAMYEDLGI